MSPKVGIEPIRQTQIIEAALRLIARKGSHNVSIQSVATAAGLSKGAVLHYYHTKDELFAAVFREFFRRIFERVSDSMAQYDAPREKLGSIADWLFDDEDPVVVFGYPLYLECMTRAIYEETFHNLFHEWVTNWVELLKDAIQQGIDSGEFVDVHPEDTARAISALCQGIASRWYLDRKQHSTEWARETLRSFTAAILEREQ